MWNEDDHPRGPDGKFTDTWVDTMSKQIELRRSRRVQASNYQWSGYRDINPALRKAKGNTDLLTGTQRRETAKLDKVLDRSILPVSVTAYRGIRNPQKLFRKKLETDLTGFEWTDHSYASAAQDPGTADLFSGPAGLMMRIRVPAGVKGALLSQTENDEVLLDRGLRYRVTYDHGYDSSGRRMLDVEVIQGR